MLDFWWYLLKNCVQKVKQDLNSFTELLWNENSQIRRKTQEKMYCDASKM